MKLLPKLIDRTRFVNTSVLMGLLLCAGAFPALAATPKFSGRAALSYTKQAVAFGPRPSGSQAGKAQSAWIVSQLRKTGAQISFDRFTAQTPDGPVAMENIIARFPGTAAHSVAVTGHYDTKKMPGIPFVGANDGASSTGFLLELAQVLATTAHRDSVYLVFFDGEEAVRNWSAADSCYGSRHLAAQWLADGTLKQIRALINVDMIGDADLTLLDDQNSSESLRSRVRSIAKSLGYAKNLGASTVMDDDHRPFAELGTNVIDLIDFDYGAQNRFWHTADDTTDKLGAHSLQIVGDITLELLKQLDGDNSK